MDGNFCCSLCPQQAVQCCLCSPRRTYLCRDCIQEHTSSKSTYHPLLPTSTPAFVTAANAAQYSQKVTTLRKLGRELEAVHTHLAQERGMLNQVFTDVYNQQARQLHKACSAVIEDTARYYDRLRSEIETFKQELVKAEQDFPVSEVTWKYVEGGFHVPRSGMLLDAASEMNKRIQVSIAAGHLSLGHCLLELVNREEACRGNCSNCREVKAALSPMQSLSIPQASAFRTCPNCGYSNSLSDHKCQFCNYQPGRPLASTWKCRYCAKVQEEPNTYCVVCTNRREAGTWKCFGCAEFNFPHMKMCEFCKGSKDLGLYLLSRGVRLSADNREWECKCQATTPIYLPDCSRCGRASKVVPKALEHNGNGLNQLTRLAQKLTHQFS